MGVMTRTTTRPPQDPYAALRNLNIAKQTGQGVVGLRGDNEIYGDVDSYTMNLSPEQQAYQSKYNNVIDLGDGRVKAVFQQPGKHKYDTLDAIYKIDPSTGQYVMDGDPTPSRQTSSSQKVRDFAEHGVPVVAAVMGAGYGLQALGAGAGAAGSASASAGALPTIGQVTMADLGMASIPEIASASALAPTASGIGNAIAAAGSASTPAAVAGSGVMDKVLAGAKTIGGMMGASDWIQLAQLGTGLYAMNQAGDRSDAALGAATGAANRQMDLSERAFDWYTKAYDDQKPSRDAAEQRARDVSNAQLEAMRFATDQAKELDAYNKTTFRPAERTFIDKSMGYDTPERRAAAAQAAAVDVDSSAALAREAIGRAMARSGVTPGGAKSIAAMEDNAVRLATARGGAMTRAVRDVEQQGFARMADVVNLGRGVPTQQATQQNIATNTGNASVGNAGAAVNASMAGNGTMQSAFNTAIQGTGAAGNLYSNIARIGTQQDEMLLGGINSIGRFFGGK